MSDKLLKPDSGIDLRFTNGQLWLGGVVSTQEEAEQLLSMLSFFRPLLNPAPPPAEPLPPPPKGQSK